MVLEMNKPRCVFVIPLKVRRLAAKAPMRRPTRMHPSGITSELLSSSQLYSSSLQLLLDIRFAKQSNKKLRSPVIPQKRQRMKLEICCSHRYCTEQFMPASRDGSESAALLLYPLLPFDREC